MTENPNLGIRFFPDACVIIGLVFDEQRFGASNKLFGKNVEQHNLPCTILPSIEKEFHRKLDNTIDRASKITDKFLSKVSFAKSDLWNHTKTYPLGLKDSILLEESFIEVYKEIKKTDDRNEKEANIETYDLVESWIMEHWSQRVVVEEREIDLYSFAADLKKLMSEARAELEDRFMNLKCRLNHIDCDWSYSDGIKSQVEPLVNDKDDAKHLYLVASYAKKSSVKQYFVTNDSGLLDSSKGMLKNLNVRIVRPAFAFPFFKSGA